MRPEEMQALLRADPFQPLRVRLTDGTAHDITYPNLAMVTRQELIIGSPAPGSDGQWATNVVYLHWPSIAAVDRLVPEGTTA